MKRKTLLSIFVLLYCSFACAQTISNGWGISTPTDYYWVYSGGTTVLDNQNDEVLEVPRIKIIDAATLEVTPATALTITESLEQTGTGKLLLISDAGGSASLITLGTVSGNSAVERFLDATNTYGWSITTPVTNAEEQVFDGAIATFYYDPLMPGWDIISGSGTLEPVRGYWTKFSSDHTVVFEGPVNTGNISYTNLYRIAPYGYGNMGWNFLGNPYPSAIDWDEVVEINGNTDFLTSTKLNQAVYISKHDGAYKSYVGGIGTFGFEGDIPAKEAFWIQVNKDYYDANNPTDPIDQAELKFNNAARYHDNITQSRKKSSQGSIIRLFAERDAATDEMIVRLIQGATEAFDPAYDAFKRLSDNPTVPQIYALISNSDKLAINSLPDNIQLPYIIPVGVRSNTLTQMHIRIDLSAFEQHQTDVYLEDKAIDIFTDMRLHNTYTYTPLTNDENQRFVLHLGAVAHITESETAPVNIYAYQNKVYVTGIENKALFELYNIMGQCVHSQYISSNPSVVHVDVTRGFYAVRVTGTSGVQSKKVYIGNN